MAKNMKKSFSKGDKIWITSHEFFLTIIKIYKEHNFWMTGNKSWDLIKWNANGNVLISEKALSKFLNDKKLTKNSKCWPHKGIVRQIMTKFETKLPETGTYLRVICIHEGHPKASLAGWHVRVQRRVKRKRISVALSVESYL